MDLDAEPRARGTTWSRGPFAFSVDPAPEDPNQSVEFGDQPVKCWCPYCTQHVVTHVELQNSWVTFLMSFVIVIVVGWPAFCVIPFLWPIFQDSVHFCPRCINTIARKQRIQFPSFKKEVMTFRCGGCAVVLARRYVATLGIILGLIFVFALLRWTGFFLMREEIERGPPTERTWHDFISHCGYRSYLGNPIHATTAFNDLFKGRTVTWEGSVAKIREGLWTKNILYVEMNPPQFPALHHVPDLGLMFSSDLNRQVSDLTLGDLIAFEATLMAFGRRGQPHVGSLWNITVLAKAEDIRAKEADDAGFVISLLGVPGSRGAAVLHAGRDGAIPIAPGLSVHIGGGDGDAPEGVEILHEVRNEDADEQPEEGNNEEAQHPHEEGGGEPEEEPGNQPDKAAAEEGKVAKAPEQPINSAPDTAADEVVGAAQVGEVKKEEPPPAARAAGEPPPVAGAAGAAATGGEGGDVAAGGAKEGSKAVGEVS
ncbi:unnamed protein product [Vitrella brassicaformis CCMP3155]|uniref:LITAF domain-containing protein n=1 Tax=Vitrella brassicaformis (strain CCMP3155) TaxID=1169540 RepID=A0A0G4FUG0_VITBC|nr:unnamed protein product [Vitrella brassicaformis CCMP3155]|mmetsp:Transcript_20492/g.49892  ORF Transcript_20492/g.49892 Transcript_20492/m.49892 type:complete len:482 (-) Transcript_20492:951-2396(-)|eukprot:CEM18568.1 unnamed protein product [Vitrella brassicaformis CCMP3155]